MTIFRNLITAALEMHPLDTDNAIIPLKERVVDEYYDPLGKLIRKMGGSRMRELNRRKRRHGDD